MITIFKNILKTMFRRKGLLISAFVFPFLSIVMMYGTLINNKEYKANIGFVDNDNSVFSEYILEHLKSNEKYQLFVDISQDDIDSYIVNKKLEAVLIINQDFGKTLIDENKYDSELVYGVDSEAVSWLKYDIGSIVNNLSVVAKASGGNIDKIKDIINSSNDSSYNIKKIMLSDNYFSNKIILYSSGFLTIFILSFSIIFAEKINDDRRSGMINRIELSNTNFKSYIVSIFLIGLILMLIESILIYIGFIILKIKISFSTLHYILAIFSFGVLAISFSLFIASIFVEDMAIATVVNIFNMPLAMLSGVMWPVSIMPEFMQKLAKFFPQNWLLTSISALQSADINNYYIQITKILFLSTIFIFLSIFFNKKCHKLS